MKWKMLLLAVYLFKETCASEEAQVDCGEFFSCSERMYQRSGVSSGVPAVFVQEGEIAALRCPLNSPALVWRKNSSLGLQELIEEVGRPQVKQKDWLFMMKVLKNDSGMYTCMEKNGVKHASINLTVYSECYMNDNLYDKYSHEKKSYVIENNFLNGPSSLCQLTTSWFKVSENCNEIYLLSNNIIHFEMVSKRDEGVYRSKHICKYKGLSYYTSETSYLSVQGFRDPLQPKIIKPQSNEIISVDLGQKVEIMCLAVLDHNSETDFVELHWINGSSNIPKDANTTVYYNSTIQKQRDQESDHMIAWLIVKNVSKDHFDAAFTCKLESAFLELINVSITLKQKVASKSVLTVSLAIVAVSAFMAVVVIIVYYKLRIDIVLFFRDIQRNQYRPTDGKQYDAYISYYQTCSEEALTKDERELLLNVLESEYGYQLCVYDRDMLPGEAAVEAVLEHVKQSRRLLLIPRAERPQAEDQYGLLGGLHAALVDRHTRLILIRTTPRADLDSLPESLRLLARSGGAVTWKGNRSAPLSSEFWKHMLYHMPARRRQQNELVLL
ncbi:interleukin-18 receptor 1-like [Brienomyrus brachyistius]|uniref:interleukin-18 receptor 1-like n=1 Tax=Brienomyrus brachyistius TaxID=42636 RepID=UPI0020B1C0EF|nr:interleukin-18 receptor 1-like [Brienomyrus brachyistius]